MVARKLLLITIFFFILLTISNNFSLCRATSHSSPGIPFKPVKVTAVDMFPHTDCVEVVMLFERDVATTKEETNFMDKEQE